MGDNVKAMLIYAPKWLPFIANNPVFVVCWIVSFVCFYCDMIS